MILELDTTLLDIFGEISINQLVFLTLVLNDNQSNNQDVHKFLSRISENDIQELIDNNLISFTTSGDNKIYSPTEKLLLSMKQDKTWFDEFYEVFPVYVMRPDGTKGFLRANINKCRKEYNRIVGKSKAMHEHLLQCLQFDRLSWRGGSIPADGFSRCGIDSPRCAPQCRLHCGCQYLKQKWVHFSVELRFHFPSIIRLSK